MAASPSPDAAGAANPLKVGDRLAGKYRVERILGEGGMGVVVAAHHELLDQHVAVKLLYQDVADREAQSRLLTEARSCAKLQSEHVARVIDVDTGDDGLPFIVMELLDGADLCQVADARGALPRWLVVDYVLQALEGLAHAHARGIIHRDLKPSNLFLANKTDGAQIIKILDFGISKSVEPGAPPPRRRVRALLSGGSGGRAVLGSPPYMSPEQVRDPTSVDHRTDIWSLGVVMYELLTNSMPFGGEEPQQTFAQILAKEPQAIRAIVNGVPEGLERVVMRCLAKNRDERFVDVSELARALVPFGSGTWMQSADRVRETLARGREEATSGARVKSVAAGRPADSNGVGDGRPADLTTQRPAAERVPSRAAPKRGADSMQTELAGTASSVGKSFTLLESRKRTVLVVAGVVAVAASLLVAGTWFQRSRREAASMEAPASTAPPPEATAVPIGAGAATGLVTAPVHMAAPESEMSPTSPVASGIALPTATLLGASTPAPPPRSTTAAPAPPARKPARKSSKPAAR